MFKTIGLIVCVCSVIEALSYDPVVKKLDSGLRYQYIRGPDGTPHLVDLWMKASDVAETSKYNPDRQNVYHLFTRGNPNVSQPMLVGNEGLLGLTNYNPARRTVILLHGWLDNVTANFNSVLVPAFLSAEDVNVIVVDWSAGAGTINYVAAVANTVPSGESVARFITWLNRVTGASPTMYHVVGHSLGAHQAGIIGRNVGGQIAYITVFDAGLKKATCYMWNETVAKRGANEVASCLFSFNKVKAGVKDFRFWSDNCAALEAASPGWLTNDNRFKADDGVYTEVIHTNAGVLGFLSTLGDVDFYPNGGINMPGCDSQECDHARSYFYLGESLTSGGFTGRRCLTFAAAMTGNCRMPGSLRMGGLVPKTGQSGIFYLETNASPPFSRG